MAYYALKVARGGRELLTDYSGTSEDYFHKTASIEFNQTIFSCHERNVDITPALLQRYGIQENKKIWPSIWFLQQSRCLQGFTSNFYTDRPTFR